VSRREEITNRGKGKSNFPRSSTEGLRKSITPYDCRDAVGEMKSRGKEEKSDEVTGGGPTVADKQGMPGAETVVGVMGKPAGTSNFDVSPGV